jgi:hypothetical protein
MIVMIGLRYEVGGDWFTYERMLQRFGSQSFEQILLSDDPGYAFLNWLAKQVGADMWFVNLICAAATVMGVVALARREPHPWLCLLLATPYLIVVVAMGYTRQAAALGFVMIGLASMLNSGNVLRLVAWAAVGALFHKTAIVCLPLAAFTGDRRKVLNMALLASAAFGLYTLLLQDKVELLVRNYVDSAYSSSGAMVRISMSVLPALVFFFYRNRLGFSTNEAKLWRNFSFVSVIAVIALALTPSSTAVDRIALYLLPLQFVILARIPGTLMQSTAGTLAVTAYSGIVLFTWLNYAVHASRWLPYRWWLES